MSPPAPLIPRALLLGNPERFSPKISPDGACLAFIAPVDGVLNIWVAPDLDLARAQPVTADRGRGVLTYGWVETGGQLWFLQDVGGDENHHLYVVDRQGGAARDLTPFDQVQARMVATSRRRPGEALVAINRRDRRWHDVHHLDFVSGALGLVFENSSFAQFLCDDELRLRLALRSTPDGGRDVLVPAPAGWRELFHIGREDVITTSPQAFGDPDGDVAFFLDSRDRDKAAAVAVDLTTGQRTVLAEHPDTDVLAIEINPLTRRPEACRTDHLRPAWTVLAADAAADYQWLAAAFDDFQITSRSADDRLWVLQSSSDTAPGRYHLFDRDAQALSELFSARPALAGRALAPMRAVVIPARDGLNLVSYLTLPPGRGAGPHPMVLLVHGGPWSRDHFGYNPEHQFWANRGYAVLSVNFRGSTGFGKAFVNAGDGEWGGRMQDDLVDAVAWAVAEGVAASDRVAIMGGSYGGYAVLTGLAFTPELFACGVDLVGPSNLETLLASFPPYWAALFETFAQRTGDPRTQAGRSLLRARSPLHRAGEIVRPLLIAQGANDVRVTRAEADQIVKAMVDRGKPVTYLLYPDEGHGFGRAANRLSFMAVAEAFLARFLGGDSETVGEALAASGVEVVEGADYVASLAASTGIEGEGG
ncbi:MAG: S9 family peptidase [Caulobacteraceae bacterium]|nr:S9 family peptidase [Caulobacteraceae bacterium]